MHYTEFLLSGDYLMDYVEEDYTSVTEPVFTKNASPVRDAIPGYFEDMTDKFAASNFYGSIRINPEYGIQQYPIVGTAPDMALPNPYGTFFYRRTVTLKTVADRVTVAFPQVHTATAVWWNGQYLGRHIGYSTHFEIEVPVTAMTVGENTLTLAVSNHRQPGFADQPVSGITSRAASEYSGGISDDVYLRVYLSPLRDAAVLTSRDLKTAEVRVEATEPTEFTWEVLSGDTVLRSGKANGNFTFPTDGLFLWSPNEPILYTLRLRAGEATLVRTFGVRRLVTEDLSFLLNGEPIYLAGVTEHCYYPLTVWPSRDVGYYRNVIRKLKELGFNYIRFHTVVPTEQYMQAADELGILLEVESPNYTSYTEWCEILRFCRRHPSVVMYCCGNELQMYEDFIEHLERCANATHAETDSLFSPINAMRGLEYAFWVEPEIRDQLKQTPIVHHPERFRTVGKFSDCYNSSVQGMASHNVLEFDDARASATVEASVEIEGFRKPRIGHESSIDGTYTDLSVVPRYRGTRIGRSNMFASIERHLAEVGLLDRAPEFFRASCESQRRMRKFIFERLRGLRTYMGYDYLGPIDTHWHTFGYDVGMMNEFYELKPGETVRRVRMYNNQTVLLNDLFTHTNFVAGEEMRVGIKLSLFGVKELKDATLDLRLTAGERILDLVRAPIAPVPVGTVSPIYDYVFPLPADLPASELTLAASLTASGLYVENEWELYAFPNKDNDLSGITVLRDADIDTLLAALRRGEDVLLTGSALPFQTVPLSLQMAKAGRTSYNLGTIINDHPLLARFPHSGICSWQFLPMMNSRVQYTNLKGESVAVSFPPTGIPFDPIVEVISTHKNAIRRAAIFEYRVGCGRLLCVGFEIFGDDPAARYMRHEIAAYMKGRDFSPRHTVTEAELRMLSGLSFAQGGGNTNFSLNPNDKAAFRTDKKH